MATPCLQIISIQQGPSFQRARLVAAQRLRRAGAVSQKENVRQAELLQV
jgi:hypothetical protein